MADSLVIICCGIEQRTSLPRYSEGDLELLLEQGLLELLRSGGECHEAAGGSCDWSAKTGASTFGAGQAQLQKRV